MAVTTTKSAVTKAIREARHKINTGQKIDRLYAYVNPRTGRVDYHCFIEGEKAPEENFIVDLTPCLESYCTLKKYNLQVAIEDALNIVKEKI